MRESRACDAVVAVVDDDRSIAESGRRDSLQRISSYACADAGPAASAVAALVWAWWRLAQLRPSGRRTETARHSCRYRIALAVAAALVSALPSAAARAQFHPTQYVATVWQTEQGLPQNSVNALLQDHDGYLWIGTYGGLARFDGERFKFFGSADVPGLGSVGITSLYESRPGVLWVGTAGGGLARLDHGVLTTYTERDGLPSGFIDSIRGDPEGNVWIKTSGGLARFAGGKLAPYPSYRGKAVREFYLQARDGSRWFRQGETVFRFGTDGSVATLNVGKPSVFLVREARDGSVWIAARDAYRLVRYYEGVFSDLRLPSVGRHPLADRHPEVAITMTEDANGELVLFTPAGLVRTVGGKLSSPEALPLPSNGGELPKVRSLLVDSEGNLWVGLIAAGLVRLRPAPLTAYGKGEGLSDGSFNAVFQDRQGRVWLGGDRLYWFDGHRFHRIPGLKAITAIAQTHDGDLWFGGYGELYRWRSGVLTRFGVEAFCVSGIFQDTAGTLWIGGTKGDRPGGLYRFREGELDRLPGISGAQNMTGDRNGGFWLMADEGLFHVQGGRMTRYDQTQVPPREVAGFYQDSTGTLWFASNGGGLLRLRDGRLKAITTGLSNNVLLRFLDDGRGGLWLSSHHGIFRVSLKDLNDFADGRLSSILPVSYGVAEGMRSSDCNWGNPGIWKTSDGRIWFPTVRGVAAIDPNAGNRLPPPVVLDEAWANQLELGRGGRTSAPPDANTFDFRFTALCLSAPEKTRFRYRLEPFDKDWVDAGTRRTAHYTNMPPGEYSFQVIAANNYGIWNDRGAGVHFVLRPHFYQTDWFRALCAAVFLALLWVAYRFRVRQLQVEFRKLRDVIETVPAMAWTARPDGANEFANRRWAEYTGLSAEETAGSGWTAAVHAEDRQPFWEKWRASMATGEPFESEARFRCAANGEYRWLLARGVPLHDERGNIVRWYGILTDIEDRKRAEETVRESETRFRTFVDHVGDAILVQDEQGTIVDVNRQGCEGLGYTRQEVVGRPPAASFCLNTDRADAEMESVTQRTARGESVFDRHLHRRKDGTVFPVEVHATLFWFGGRRLLLKAVRDISESVRAEEAVRKSAKQLREVIDTIPAYVWSALPDGSLDFINQRWLDFSGFSLEQGLGRGWEQAIHPEDRDQFLEAWRRAIGSGKAMEAEARVRRADGQYRWLLIRNVPLQDETGTIVKWYGTSNDIDDRKRAEQALRRSEAYLAYAQRLTHTGAWASDSTTAPLYWSEEVFRIFGFDPQHGLPTPDEPIKRIHPEDLEKFKRGFDRAIYGKVDSEVEYRILLPDGTVKHVYGIGHPVLNSQGELVELVGIVADITERKRAEEERERLRQVEADLAHINRVSMMGELAASIAHEVNQPLSGIVSNGGACLRWLAGDAPDVEEVREALRDIVRDGKRAGDVIARIRALTKRTALPREKLDLNEMIREVLALVGDEAKRNSVTIRRRFAEDVLPVLGDRVQLQQVVLNLVMNAIEAMSSVGERARELVIITRNIGPDQVQVTVEDTGMGVDPNTMARIFEPFYTTKSGGMGMGLSISRSIVQSHGGRLWATANDGSGTSFHFTVPKHHEEETNAGAAAF